MQDIIRTFTSCGGDLIFFGGLHGSKTQTNKHNQKNQTPWNIMELLFDFKKQLKRKLSKKKPQTNQTNKKKALAD